MFWKCAAATLVLLCAAGCGEDKPLVTELDSDAPDESATQGSAEPRAPKPSEAKPTAPEKGASNPGASKANGERQAERDHMVQVALVEWGVKDETVLDAMRRCPRHRFVPEQLQHMAYRNRPLPIGWDQTISQPTIVGSMTEELALTPKSKVLELGTGSGYQAAMLAEITPHVYSIEIKKPLADRARIALAKAGYQSVALRHGDGYYGWPEEAPFDAIIVTAAAPHVPPPLVKQLKPGGRLVIPVGPPFARQDLVLVIKDEKGKVHTQSLYAVAFVPLTGSLGKSGN